MYRTLTDIALPVTLALVFIAAGLGLSLAGARPQPAETAPAAQAVPAAR